MYVHKGTFRKLETLVVAKWKQHEVKNHVQTLKMQ